MRDFQTLSPDPISLSALPGASIVVVAEQGAAPETPAVALAIGGLLAVGLIAANSDSDDTPADDIPPPSEAALALINEYDESNTAPMVADYATAGVTRVDAANLDAVNTAVLESPKQTVGHPRNIKLE